MATSPAKSFLPEASDRETRFPPISLSFALKGYLPSLITTLIDVCYRGLRWTEVALPLLTSFLQMITLSSLKQLEGAALRLKNAFNPTKTLGQCINFEKSAISFNKHTSQTNVTFVKHSLQLSVCQGHDIFLGLPTFSARSKRTQFGYFRDRVAKRLDGWKNRFFSEGGREVLIKTII